MWDNNNNKHIRNTRCLSPSHVLPSALGHAGARPATCKFHTCRHGDTDMCRHSDTGQQPRKGKARPDGIGLGMGWLWLNSPALSGWHPGSYEVWPERCLCNPSNPEALHFLHCTAALDCHCLKLQHKSIIISDLLKTNSPKKVVRDKIF